MHHADGTRPAANDCHASHQACLGLCPAPLRSSFDDPHSPPDPILTTITPWTVLGLDPSCSESDLKRQYARLIRQHRPEHDPEAFARIRAAYELALAHARHHAQAADLSPGQVEVQPVAAPVPGTTPAPPPAHTRLHEPVESLVAGRPALEPLQGWTGAERSEALQRAVSELETWFKGGSWGAWWTDRRAPLGHVFLLSHKLDIWDHEMFVREGLRLYLAYGLKAPCRAAQWGEFLVTQGSLVAREWQAHADFHAQVDDLCGWISIWLDGELAQATSPWQLAASRGGRRPWFCAEDDLIWPQAVMAMADQKVRLRGVVDVPPTPPWIAIMRQGPRILHSEWVGALIAAMVCEPLWWQAMNRGPHLRDPEAAAAAAPWPWVIAVTVMLTCLLTVFLSGSRQLRLWDTNRRRDGLTGRLSSLLIQGTTAHLSGAGALRWILLSGGLGMALGSALQWAGLQSAQDLVPWCLRFMAAGWIQAILHQFLAAAEVPRQMDAIRLRLSSAGQAGRS